MDYPNKPDHFICSFGAKVLGNHLAAFQAEIDGVRNSTDIEYIHRMRVATRRLRSALPLFIACFPQKKATRWIKHFKRITQALGNARDTDVQIGAVDQVMAGENDPILGPGLKRLRLRLTQKRQGLQEQVNTALEDILTSNVLEEMRAFYQQGQTDLETGEPFSFTLYQLGAGAIHARLEQMLSYEPFIHQPEHVDELHAMRIAAKWLRYTMEVFAVLYPDQLKKSITAVKLAQEALGNIHDCDVWAAFLPQFIQEERDRMVAFYGHAKPLNPLLPGIHFFQRDRLQIRQDEYARFLKEWQKWSKKALWVELLATVNQPLLRIDRMYPPLGTIGYYAPEDLDDNR